MLPNILKNHIQNNLEENILSSSRVSGGSINEAAKIQLESTGSCFLKWNHTVDPDMFSKEVKGLTLLDSAGTGLVIPEVIECGVDSSGTGFLLLEFIEEGRASEQSATKFGHELGKLHKVTDEKFGLDHHNYIGRLPQSNSRHTNWTTFFIEERMEPQLKMAIDAGKLSSGISNAFDNMFKELPDIFPDETPSLLHGDLWGGNYYYNTDGRATIYDPAVYYGHREIEVAFTHLFGGFSSGFYSAYEEFSPLEPNFDNRKNIYNLYPLLVHTNLFGGHYGRQVESIVNKFK